MSVDVEQLRVEVYRTFAQTGRPPTVDELADEVAGETTEVRAALRQLARGRHLSLDVDDAIVMAHPFFFRQVEAGPVPRCRSAFRS